MTSRSTVCKYYNDARNLIMQDLHIWILYLIKYIFNVYKNKDQDQTVSTQQTVNNARAWVSM